MICDDSTNPEPLRQSAIVNMKTFLEKHWAPKSNDPNHYIIPLEEKQIIKNSIIDALTRCV